MAACGLCGAFRRAAILALVAFPIADFLCNTAKKLFPMHRPFQELADVAVRVGRSNSMGTASSHAGNLAAVPKAWQLALSAAEDLPAHGAAVAVRLS